MPTTRSDDLPAAPKPGPKPADAGEAKVEGQSRSAEKGRDAAADRVEEGDDHMTTIDA